MSPPVAHTPSTTNGTANRTHTAQCHLLHTASLTQSDITHLLELASAHHARNQRSNKHYAMLQGQTLITLFFEHSTRTRASFELAAKRLGADVCNIAVEQSSIKKGETLEDTARTLNAMHTDYLVVRHSEDGAIERIADVVDAHVINAGSGCLEHPTQALLDAMTLHQHYGELEGLVVAICGDIAHSRVARSNALLLHIMGATVRFVGPKELVPEALAHSHHASIHHSMADGLANADAVMMLRIQHERMQSELSLSATEFHTHYGLHTTSLAYAKPDAVILHPGPINRNVEISSELADHPTRSLILKQVENGVAMRQAILEWLKG